MSVEPDILLKRAAFLIFSVLLISCAKPTAKEGEKPLARVLDHYLYKSDMSGFIPAGITGDDSIAMARDFKERWIRNQLLLNKAELNLTDEEKNVEQQIENYRSSLLIYAYEQSYIRQHLDTVVTDSEIENFYKENQSNFILNGTLIKGVFIKIPVKSPDAGKVRQWYRSDNPESIKNLEGYCFKYATVYDHFNDGWVKLNEVLPMIPAVSANSEAMITSRRYIEARDTAFLYFLNAKEIASSGNVSPLEIVKNDIESIILNKRKISLINELESNIYSDAQNRDHFTIYQ
jgi:hypothetical protein